MLLYGTPRLTRDIDITLGIGTAQFSLVRKICQKLRLKILCKKPEAFAHKTHVLPTEDTKLRIRVDFIFSFTPYERQAMQRIRKVRMTGYPVKFASADDVIIHKMFAGRAIDLEDVRNILLKQRQTLDVKYIRQWLLQFSQLPDHRGIVKAFNGMWRSL